MRKSRKIISMPIISIIEGVQIGSVKGLVVNPEQKEIAALIVDQKGWFREEKIIPYNKVSNVGDDAITIDQSANAEKPTNLPEILKLLREKTDPIGMKAISEKGRVLGYIDEYYVDEATGKIVSMEISGRFMEGLLKGKGLMDAGAILTMGTDAVVVRTGAEENISKIDGGLQETFTNLKDSTSSLWSTTRQKTIEISKSIKEKTTDKVKSMKEGETPSEITSAPEAKIYTDIEEVVVMPKTPEEQLEMQAPLIERETFIEDVQNPEEGFGEEETVGEEPIESLSEETAENDDDVADPKDKAAT